MNDDFFNKKTEKEALTYEPRKRNCCFKVDSFKTSEK